MMSVDDPARQIASGTPSETQDDPAKSDQSNSKPENIGENNNQKAGDDKRSSENNYPQWRERFRNIRNRVPRNPDFWLVVFTAVLALETAITIWVLLKTDAALHKTSEAQQKATEIADRMREITEDNERAWVGPNDARIFDNKEKDKPLKVTVSIMNSGRQPALANMYMMLKRYPADAWESDAYKTDVFMWQANCFEKDFSDNLATRQIFPGFIPGSNTYNLTASSDKATPPFVVTDELIRGDDVVVALGCYVYEAFKIMRRTMFCYSYDKNGDANHLAYCPIGQYAN